MSLADVPGGLLVRGPSERCLLTLFAGLSLVLLVALVSLSKQMGTDPAGGEAAKQQLLLRWTSPAPTPSPTAFASSSPSPSSSRSASPLATPTPSGSGTPPPLHPVLSLAQQWARFDALPCIDTYEPLDTSTSCASYDNATDIPTPWFFQFPGGYSLPFNSPEAGATQRLVAARACAGVWRSTRHVCVPPSRLPSVWTDVRATFPAAHSFVDGYVDGTDSLPPRSLLPPCSTATEDSEMRAGTYDDATGYWQPASCRLPTGLTRADLKRCLKGKRIAIMGDSLMRQLFNRLISLIRGDPVTVDHYFHQHAWYRWDTVTDTDELTFLPPGCTREAILAKPADQRVCAPEDVTDPRFKPGGVDPDAFHLMLIWNPVLTDDPAAFDGIRWAGALVEDLAPTSGPNASLKLLQWQGTQHLFTSLNYWASPIIDQTGEAGRVATVMADLIESVDSLTSLHWIGHPCHGPLRGGDGYLPHLSRDAMVRYELKALRGTLKAAAQANPVPGRPKAVHLVDACGFAPFMEARHRCADNTHFQTVFEPRAPLAIRGVKGITTFTTQDFYNFNLLRVLLPQVCPELAAAAAAQQGAA